MEPTIFPIDIITRQGAERTVDYRERFAQLKERNAHWRIADTNEKHGLKTGDVILFRNGYDVEMITEILGFDDDGKAFMLWDCFWAPIDMDERLIRKMNYTTTEICENRNGTVVVKYRRDHGSEEAKNLMKELEALPKETTYFVRHCE